MSTSSRGDEGSLNPMTHTNLFRDVQNVPIGKFLDAIDYGSYTDVSKHAVRLARVKDTEYVSGKIGVFPESGVYHLLEAGIDTGEYTDRYMTLCNSGHQKLRVYHVTSPAIQELSLCGQCCSHVQGILETVRTCRETEVVPA